MIKNSCLVALKRTHKLNKITYTALVGCYVFLLLTSAFYTKKYHIIYVKKICPLNAKSPKSHVIKIRLMQLVFA